MGIETLRNALFDAVKCASANKQNVAGVDVDIVLVGVLSASLWRHVDHCALEQFEQALLHTLAAYIACDWWVVGFAGNFVYLVDKHNAAFGLGYIVIGHLQQTRKNAFNVLAYIAGLGKYGGVDNGEWHIEQAGYGAGKQCFARAGWANHDDVRLFNFNIIVLFAVCGLGQSLVVVVNGYAHKAFGVVLPYDVLVEVCLDVLWLWHFIEVNVLQGGFGVFAVLCGIRHIFLKHVEGTLHAVWADVAIGAVEHHGHFALRAAAEWAFVLFFVSHI